MNVKDRLLNVINESLQTPVGSVSDEEKFLNYPNFDSMGFMMFVMELEKEFQMTMTNAEIIEMTSIETALIIINRKLN